MDLPMPSLGPPPMPTRAIPIVLRIFDRHAAEMLWAACYWSGFASATLAMVVVLGLIQFARSRRA